VRELYSFAVRPDLALYFRVPIEVSIERLMARRVKLKFYEAGIDMGWTTNPVESFRLFQSKVLEEYERLVDEYGLQVIDAAAASPSSSGSSGGWSPTTWRRPMPPEPARPTDQPAGGVAPGSYYGHGLAYVPLGDYPGKIIAIEGTDGVGRTTQMQLLREWLEVRGYGVVETGWTRSTLMQPTIDLAKASNTLNRLTFVLLYATDFADRLEKEIIPALKAGFIVLSDRYIFTALARAAVRGVDRAWLRSLYGFAIAPHLVFYLKVDVDTVTRRVLQSGGMDYWESGTGHEAGRRHPRQLSRLPGAPAPRIQRDGRRVRLPRDRRPAPDRDHPERSPPAGGSVPRRGPVTRMVDGIHHPCSCIPHPAFCIPHPHPASCIPHPASCILHPAFCILHSAFCILHPPVARNVDLTPRKHARNSAAVA
jgi:thymidylate kinase